MSQYPTTAPDPEDADRRRRQRYKLAVMIIIFGPIVLFMIFHLGYAIYKMKNGEAVGYQQRDHRAAQVD